MRSKLAERALVAMCVASLAAGCRTERYTSPIDTRIPVVGGGVLCLEREGFDTFVLDVLAIDAPGVEAPGTATLCSLCGRDPRVRCELVARTCRCSGPRRDPRRIEEALLGARLDGLPADRSLCARMMLFSRGASGPTEGPAAECGDEVVECDAESVVRPSLCALTDAFAVSPSETPVSFVEFVCNDPPVSPGDGGVLGCDALVELCRRGQSEACMAVRDLCAPDGGTPRLGPLTLDECAALSRAR